MQNLVGSDRVSRVMTVSGRDVSVEIDGKKLLQAESAELRQSVALHRIRTCFCSDDKAYMKGRKDYKLHLVGVRFLQPFENCNFADIDDFEVTVTLDGFVYRLKHCCWDDYAFVINKERMREHISVVALAMETEE